MTPTSVKEQKVVKEKFNSEQMTEYILTVLGGGPDSAEAIPTNIQVELRNLIKQLSCKKYTDYIDKFKIILMIEGSLTKYNEVGGVKRIRLNKSSKKISSEIIIKEDDWRNKPRNLIKDLLKKRIKSAYEAMIERVKKESIDIDGIELINDLDALFVSY